MSEPAKKKKAVPSDEAKKRKREQDRQRARSRVNIGPAYTRWRELRDATRCKTDGDLALLLLDFYQARQVASTPSKATHFQPPQLPVSSIEESDRDRDDFAVQGVQPLDKQEVGVLEASMHSLSIAEEEQCDSPDEAERNYLRNSTIDMDERWADPRFCEDGDSSDEDYAPFLQIRPGGAADIEQLHEISLDEAVLDVAMPSAEDDVRDIPESHKVDSEDDLVGKNASIVYHDNLKTLATYLQLPIQRCSSFNNVTGEACSAGPPFEVTLKTRGSGVILEWICPFGHSLWRWNSQPLLKYGMQGGDLMLAINILLSGNNYRKIAFLFNFMKIGMVAEPTFFKVQDAYCIEPVEQFWQKIRADVLTRLKEKDEVVVLGDGRMDSPGYCAQYCTYTTIEQDTRDIVHIVSVDKRETSRNSVIMEKECFIRTMDAILPEIHVTEVVTDAHPQITALLNPERGKYKAHGLKHSLDIWHAAKNLGKKIRRAGTVRDQSDLLPWIKDIVNHFWYCAKHASSVEQFKMKWHALLHHVRNQHTWPTGCCEHAPLGDRTQEKPWIKQGSAAHQALTAIVLDKRWLKDVGKFITFRSTSDLENFQNHILMYAGKRFAYSPAVYRTRTLLAAIDYNSHNRRLPARNRDGQKMYRRYYNKKSKCWSVYALKEKKDYGYIPDLQRAIVRRRLTSGAGLPRRQTLRLDDPRRLGLLAAPPPPPTSELVQSHVARGDVPQRE